MTKTVSVQDLKEVILAQQEVVKALTEAIQALTATVNSLRSPVTLRMSDTFNIPPVPTPYPYVPYTPPSNGDPIYPYGGTRMQRHVPRHEPKRVNAPERNQ